MVRSQLIFTDLTERVLLERYCVEIPVGGERIFEGGDIKLLELMKKSNDKSKNSSYALKSTPYRE